MTTEKLRGSIVALVTPFDRNGNIDVARLQQLTEWHISMGTDVILVGGTTGESATLTHEEHHQVMDVVLHQADGRIPIICGAGSNATHEAISLSRHAEKAGADAILSICPYYNKPTQEGLFQHFKTIAESTSLPIIIYNVPGRTGVNLAASTLMRLAQIPNIIGIKEASGNLSQIMEILKDRPDGFLVFSGDDALTLPLLSLGADGVISVAANEIPREMKEMVHAAFRGDWARARELHFRYLPLMEINFLETNPIPVKTALAMMGKIEESFRLPLVAMQPANRERLRSMLLELNLI